MRMESCTAWILVTPCVLSCSPVYVTPDPIRGDDNVLVLCEVFYPDGTPHETNTRAKLEALIDDKVREQAPLYGFEQVSLSCNRSPWPAVQQIPYTWFSGGETNACLPACLHSISFSIHVCALYWLLWDNIDKVDHIPQLTEPCRGSNLPA